MYNKTKTPRKPDAVSYEGGASYKYDDKLELIGILVTGFGNTFYEKLGDREIRLKNLIEKIGKKDPTFVAKALVYARSVVGQRSATQFGAVALASSLSGNELAKAFFSKRDRKGNTGGIIHRLDDMLEIVSCYNHFNPGKPLPNAMKKGFRLALEKADTYELAKYQGKNKSVSLVDVINLVHPKPSNEMEGVFRDIMNGELKQFNTVEDKNTKAGQEVAAKVKAGEITKEQAEVELSSVKEENYIELIKTGKIGYLALIRNLRNMVKDSSSSKLIDEACILLVNEQKIKGSLVFPHQIDLALEIMLSEGLNVPRKLLTALDKAYELSIPNLTDLFTHGRTAIVFDTSASMGGMGIGGAKTTLPNGKKSQASALEKASLVAATLAKGVEADVFHFATGCFKIIFNPLDSVNTLKQKFMGFSGKQGHGTSFNSIFTKLIDNGGYDRVFIISDLQGNIYISPNNYRDMHIYSIDIAGYGTSMFKPGNKLYQLFGYTSELYELIRKVEADPKVLLEEINNIVI